jgi:GNAT superfamily N-acetyltransferase
VTTFAFASPLGSSPYVTAPLRDGEARLRPLLPGELAPQRAVFEGLAPGSRADRYLTGIDALTPAMWRALAAVDGHHHVAWLATVDGRPAGIGRFVRVEPCTADIAFEVADEYQGRGLGTALLDAVTTVAAAKRIRRLQATALGTNRRSRRLLARVGVTLRPSGGLLEGDSLFHLLHPPPADRPAVLRLALVGQGSHGPMPRSA